MPTPKELKSPASAGKPENIESPVPSKADENIDISAGLSNVGDQQEVPDISAGLQENAFESKYKAPYDIRSIESQLPLMKFGAEVALPAAVGATAAVASAPAATGILSVGGTAAAVNYFFDALKNYSVTDPAQKKSGPKMFFDSALSGVLSGAGEGVARAFMAKAAAKAAGNKAVLKMLDDHMRTNYGYGLDSLDEMVKQGITLTPDEAFPFSEQAVEFARDVLKEFPNIGNLKAERIGRLRNAILGMANRISGGSRVDNLKDYASVIEDGYSSTISNLQKQVNSLGSETEVRAEGQQILDLIKNEILERGGKFEGDVLTGDFERLGDISNIYTFLLNKLRIPAKRAEYSRIVDASGNPIIISEATPEAISQLSVGDIDLIRRRLQNAANWKKSETAGLTPEEVVGRKLYRPIRDIRDNLNQRIADEYGSPVLSEELRSFRNQYNSEIDGLRLMQSELDQLPADQIKYLFDKKNAKNANAIVKALSPEKLKSVRGEFITRLVDPVYLKEAGVVAPKQTLSSAYQELLSYDPNVLTSLFSKDELSGLSKMLKTGEIIETIIAKTGKSPENLRLAVDLTNSALYSKVRWTREAFKTISRFLAPNDLRKYIDARMWLAGQLGVEEMAPGALQLANKLSKSGKATVTINKPTSEFLKRSIPRVGTQFGIDTMKTIMQPGEE